MNDLKMGWKLFRMAPMKASSLFGGFFVFVMSLLYFFLGDDSMIQFGSLFVMMVAFFISQLLQYNNYFSIFLVSEKKERIQKRVIPNCMIILVLISYLVLSVILVLCYKMGRLPETSVCACFIIGGFFGGSLTLCSILSFRYAILSYAVYIISVLLVISFGDELTKATSDFPMFLGPIIGIALMVVFFFATRVAAVLTYRKPYSPIAGRMMLRKEAKNI